MFKRLLRDEEERKMEFTEGIAVEVNESDISQRIKERNEPIPKYLKRIKRDSTGKIYLLKSTIKNNYELKDNVILVKVPAFEPITKEQYADANSVWPSHFYNHVTETVDQKNLDRKLSILFDKSVEYFIKNQLYGTPRFCSGVCMIFDGDTLISTESDEGFVLNHAVMTSIRSVSMSKRGYLCTGYTAFLFQEPCLSCAMAFVHGRIKNVFVIRKLDDGSFSKHKLNYNKHLNHRFNVYFHV